MSDDPEDLRARMDAYRRSFEDKPPSYPGQIQIQSIEIDSGFANAHAEQVVEISRLQLVFSLAGLVAGILALLGGIILCLAGVIGHTTWTAHLLGLESKINDAAPGVVLDAVGLFIFYITRFDIRVKR